MIAHLPAIDLGETEHFLWACDLPRTAELVLRASVIQRVMLNICIVWYPTTSGGLLEEFLPSAWQGNTFSRSSCKLVSNRFVNGRY